MCSYCGCKEIEVIGRYMDEHEEIVNLLAVLHHAIPSGDDAQIVRAAGALADALAPHTGSEERSLFAELRLDEDFVEHIDRLCGEHTSLDVRLAAIARGDHEDFHTFEVALRNHMDREENGLFPAAAIALDGPAWDRVHERA